MHSPCMQSHELKTFILLQFFLQLASTQKRNKMPVPTFLVLHSCTHISFHYIIELFMILCVALKGWPYFFFFFFICLLGFYYFNHTVMYYSMICRPSDHTVGRPRAETRTWAGRPRGRDTTPRPPHHLPPDTDTKSCF